MIFRSVNRKNIVVSLQSQRRFIINSPDHIIKWGDMMNCCITDLRNKEVICGKTGCRLGCVSDVEIDTCSGCLVSVIIWGKCRCFGLMGRDEDIKICWKDIEVIGDDTIIVCGDFSCHRNTNQQQRVRRNIFENLFKY